MTQCLAWAGIIIMYHVKHLRNDSVRFTRHYINGLLLCWTWIGREHLGLKVLYVSSLHLHCLWNALELWKLHDLLLSFLFLSLQEFFVTALMVEWLFDWLERVFFFSILLYPDLWVASLYYLLWDWHGSFSGKMFGSRFSLSAMDLWKPNSTRFCLGSCLYQIILCISYVVIILMRYLITIKRNWYYFMRIAIVMILSWWEITEYHVFPILCNIN